MGSGGWLGAMKWWIKPAEFNNFKVKWPKLRPRCTQTSQITCITKSMAYMMNQSGGDFQQGGCLYKPNSGSQWLPEYA